MIHSSIPRTVSTQVPYSTAYADTDTVSDADMVAEAIEAGYDEQSAASVRPLANDPSSSRDGENKDIE